MSVLGRVLFCDPSSNVRKPIVMTHWWFHSSHVGIWPASQLQVDQLLLSPCGKHDIAWSPLGQVVRHRMVTGMG